MKTWLRDAHAQRAKTRAPTTARDLFSQVADALKARKHTTMVDDYVLLVDDVAVAWVSEGGEGRAFYISEARVFNGHHHYVPDGHTSMTVTPGSPHATVERIVAAIEKRMAARAKSLPVSVDASAIVRDP